MSIEIAKRNRKANEDRQKKTMEEHRQNIAALDHHDRIWSNFDRRLLPTKSASLHLNDLLWVAQKWQSFTKGPRLCSRGDHFDGYGVSTRDAKELALELEKLESQAVHKELVERLRNLKQSGKVATRFAWLDNENAGPEYGRRRVRPTG